MLYLKKRELGENYKSEIMTAQDTSSIRRYDLNNLVVVLVDT